MAALITPLQMPTHGSSSAFGNGSECLELVITELVLVGKLATILFEYVGDIQRMPCVDFHIHQS